MGWPNRQAAGIVAHVLSSIYINLQTRVHGFLCAIEIYKVATPGSGRYNY